MNLSNYNNNNTNNNNNINNIHFICNYISIIYKMHTINGANIINNFSHNSFFIYFHIYIFIYIYNSWSM